MEKKNRCTYMYCIFIILCLKFNLYFLSHVLVNAYSARIHNCESVMLFISILSKVNCAVCMQFSKYVCWHYFKCLVC